MRHLTEKFALSALLRGAQIEQFLGSAERSGVRGIRWVEIVPHGGRYHVHVIEVQDVGGDDFFDVVEFAPLDPADESEGRRQLAVAGDPAAAMAVARQHLNTDDARWVNCGMIGAEYRDYVQNGRQAR